jgi:NAD(P)-dependent dehydrogenase (short-subunit alcohol dehydrogenase family)
MMTPNQDWTAANMPDLLGRTIVVTGASSGIGTDASREFARAGARVVLAVRNVAKGEAAARTITGNTDVRELDLASLASVRSFADNVGDVDVLVNNAGIMYAPKGLTADGFELHIGTNHLAHFALTNLLLDRLTDRVVTITSASPRAERSISTISTGNVAPIKIRRPTPTPSRPTFCLRSNCNVASRWRDAASSLSRQIQGSPRRISSRTRAA